MHHKSNKPDYVSVWATIDLDKVRQRINLVTCQINQVLQKYELSSEADNLNNTNH
jgi:hypothetical protein